MNVEKIFDEILEKATNIIDFWNNNKFSSKKVRKEVEYNFFQNKNADFASKFAYFYALDSRISKKYSNIFKIFFRYFSWKKETKLRAKIKQFLSFPNYQNAKNIVLKKINDYINGEDCFESNSKSNGKNLQNKRLSRVEEKEAKTQISNEQPKQANKNVANNIVKEDGLEEIIVDEKSEKQTSFDKENFYAQNPEFLNTDLEQQPTMQTPQNDFIREKLEIPKTDLLSPTLQATKIRAKNQQKVVLEKEQKSSQTITKIDDDIILPKDSDILLNINKNLTESGKKQDDYIMQYEPPQSSKNFASEKQNDFVPNNNANEYAHVKSQLNSINNSYEQQKNEIVKEEISKLSEQDVQSIKDYMQQRLNEQMDLAEKQGEVYKMPLSLKEVIEPKTLEKSQVQVNKTNNKVLKKNN